MQTTWTLYLNGEPTSYQVYNTEYNTDISQWVNSGISYQFSEAKTYNFQLYYVASYFYGDYYYCSNFLTYVVGDSSQTSKQTDININVPSMTTIDTPFTITYNVFQKDSNVEVDEGILRFYDETTQIGSDIDLSNHNNQFTYTYSTLGNHNIHAEYVGTDKYENSQSGESTITITDSTAKINNVVVEIQSVTLPDEITVNLMANLTGVYRIYFNTTSYIDINITTPNQKTSKTCSLSKGSYETTVEELFVNEEYTLNPTNAKFTVYSQNDISANLIIREANHLDQDSEVTITADNSYDFKLVYWLDKPNADISIDKLICYMSSQEPVETTKMTTGEYVTFISTSVSSSGSVSFKLVYNATLSDGSEFIKESNELTVIFEINEVSSGFIQIKDKNTGNMSKVTVNDNGTVTIDVMYYVVSPESKTYLSDIKVEFWVNNIKNKTINYPSYDLWAEGLSLTFDVSSDVSIKAVFSATGFSMFNVPDVYEQSNTLTYDININEHDVKSISIESKEIDYGTKANLTVKGSDGQYTVFVDKNYTVNVSNGIGYVIIDVLDANKVYDVSITSNDDQTLKNTSKLTINPISPNLIVDISNKELTYGDLTTITVSKHVLAKSNVQIYDNDVLLDNLENIKLTGGIHTIKAIYVADNNFTSDEATLTINVKKAINELILIVTNETYPDNVTITLKATVSGDYAVQIGVNEYVVQVNEGVGLKSIQLKSGNYTAVVEYGESQNYSSNSASCNFHVDGTTIDLKVILQDDTIEIGGNIKLNTSCGVSDALGDVVFKSDDDWQTTAKIGETIIYAPKTSGKHQIEVSYGDDNYNPQSVIVNVFVTKKANNIKVEVTPATYPEDVVVWVIADVDGVYTVNINGTNHEIYANSFKSIKLDAGVYDAKIIYENDTYEGLITNSSFNVTKALNNIVITAINVTLPDMLTVNITATKAGNYTIKFDDNHNVTVSVAQDNSQGSASLLLPANTYNLTIIDYNDKNYDAKFMPVNVTVFPEPISASLEIRDGNKINQNEITGDLIYSWLFEYKLTHSNQNFTSEKIVIYCNDFEYYTINNPSVGDFTNLGGYLMLTDIGEYEFKAVWIATTETESFNKTSNIIKFKIVSNPSSILSIRDKTYTQNQTITLTGKDSVNVNFEYLLSREDINYYLYEKNLTVYVNGEAISSTESILEGDYAGITLTYVASVDIDVYVTFKGKNHLPASYDEISNVLTYHIVIGDEDNTLTVEALSVDDTQNATITVKSNVDGDYTVNVNDKDYNITITGGEAKITIDRLDYGSYEVNVMSKDNESFKNTTTLIISDSRIKTLTIDAKDTTYPNNATLTVKTNKNGDYIVVVNNEEYNITIISNELTFNINQLSVGEYDVSIKAKDNESFNNQTKLNITKGTNNVKIIIDDLIYLPDKVNIKVTADVDGEYLVDINTTQIKVNVLNGEGMQTIELASGIYNAKINTTEIDFDNYNVEITNADFEVSEKTNTLTIKDQNYPSNTTITISGDEYIANIEYLLIEPSNTHSGDSLYVNVNGEVNEILSIVYGTYTKYQYKFNKTGIYTIQFNYTYMTFDSGISMPYELSNAIVYDITLNEKINETVLISVDGANYPSNVNISFKTSVDGEYKLYVNETDYDIVITNNEGYKIIENLSAGEYKVTLILKTNESIKNTTIFAINKANPMFVVFVNESENMMYGDKIKITYSINPNATGTISIYDNSNILDSINVGEEFSELILPSGNHILEVKYLGNQNYTNASSNTINVYIKGLTNNVKLSITNTTYPNNVSVKIKATLNGNYTLTIDDTQMIDIVVENNEYETTLQLNEGNHNAYLTYKDLNPIYESETVYTSFNVKSSQSNIVEEALSINSPKNGDNPTFEINLPSDAGGILSVIINNITYSEVVINGKANVEITDLNVGNYTALIRYSGDNKYSASEYSTTFNVNKVENPLKSAYNINIKKDSTAATITINLTNDATGIINITVDGNIISSLTPKNGKASITTSKLTQGIHNISISYSGDNKYQNDIVSEEITIYNPKITNNKDMTVIYNSGSTYGVYVYGSDGKLVTSQNVLFTINGVKTYSKTNNKGYASIKLTQSPGTYQIQVSSVGITVNNKIIVKHIITAKNINVKKSAKILKIKVNLVKMLKSKKITLKFKGKKYTSKTNSKGVATFKIKKNILQKLKVGKRYTYTVVYLKDIVNKKITIKK